MVGELQEDVTDVILKSQNGIKRRLINLMIHQPVESECDLTDSLFQLQKILDDFESNKNQILLDYKGKADITTNMKSAPKDELILLWVPEFGVFSASWWTGMWSWVGNCWKLKTPFSKDRKQVFLTEFPMPTHWVPLPENPSQQPRRDNA